MSHDPDDKPTIRASVVAYAAQEIPARTYGRDLQTEWFDAPPDSSHQLIERRRWFPVGPERGAQPFPVNNAVDSVE